MYVDVPLSVFTSALYNTPNVHYLTLFDMGGGGIRPPSSFSELYEKVLEVET